ncbi:tetratricopeptide repeat protein [Microcystis aeruginosa]|nr:tetratricopeptide repeat protein [Microcystis aeruginosa]
MSYPKSTSQLWMCPKCGSTLKKGADVDVMNLLDPSKLVGIATCSSCGATFSQKDVYSGKYDPQETETTSASQTLSHLFLLLRTLVLVLGTLVLGFALVTPLVNLLRDESSTTAPKPTPAFTTKEFQKQEYEIILEREPDNQIALQGLLGVQIEMQDFQGASTTLEKLIALNPEETAYQAMYQSIKRHLHSPVEDSKVNLKH